MRIFLSAGEPSGDLHGSNLTTALRQARPETQIVGFGGERMAAAGCEILYPLCQLAVMGFSRIVSHLPAFYRVLRQADEYFRAQRPDAVVLIDYPGFHWWLARKAKAHGIPVIYFVPPQLWAWAGWRVRKMRRSVDHVLCNLPFEEPWYRQRGVAAHYVGHPYYDELHTRRVEERFLAEQRARPGRVIGLLPGSRKQEVELNLPTLLGAAARIHSAHPETRFLVACFSSAHRDLVLKHLPASGIPLEVHAGRTPEIIRAAWSCIAVSGSVGLELLHEGKPSLVIYRAHPVPLFLSHFLRTCPYISLVNLLAGRELFPEFLSHREESQKVAHRLLHWLEQERAYEEVRAELFRLREEVGQAGACRRAAERILEIMEGPGGARPARAA